MKLVLRKTTDPPAPLPSAADHDAAVDKATRHLLEAMWAERARLGGFEVNVFSAMAKLDLATARRWAEAEKANGKGKSLLDRLAKGERERKLFEVAKTDPDEAIAVAPGGNAQQRFEAVYDLAKKLRPVDRAKAGRLAEEAVVRAGRRHAAAGLVAGRGRVPDRRAAATSPAARR